jgi:ribonuclease HI
VQVRQLMSGFEKVVFEHVRREFNTRADDLAGDAARISARQTK